MEHLDVKQNASEAKVSLRSQINSLQPLFDLAMPYQKHSYIVDANDKEGS